MSADDLEAEGMLTLVQCCQAFPPGQLRFGRYFKRAWYNRIKKFIRRANQKKRQGLEVELTAAEHIMTPDDDTEFKEKMRENAARLRSSLTWESLQFLEALIDPGEEVLEYAWREWCRKRKIASQGIRTPGSKQFRVRTKHIRKVLHMSSARMSEAISEIQHEHEKITRRVNG